MTALLLALVFGAMFAAGFLLGRARGRGWGRRKAAEVAEHGRAVLELVGRHPHGRQALREARRALERRG